MLFKLIGKIVYNKLVDCECIDREIEAVSGEEAVNKAREFIKSYPEVYECLDAVLIPYIPIWSVEYNPNAPMLAAEDGEFTVISRGRLEEKRFLEFQI